MADTYWDHPSRRETKRLLDLADVGAILDELQQGSTEWDDAREALDHLVRDSRAEVERLRAELTQVTTATTYLQGPEECLERECEEYFDDHGNERPGVEYCSHLKAKRLTVDEHLAAEAERDRLAEQVKRVRDRHPHKTDDADCMDADTTLGCQHGPGYHVVEYCGTCDEEWPCAEIRALDGTEAGR